MKDVSTSSPSNSSTIGLSSHLFLILSGLSFCACFILFGYTMNQPIVPEQEIITNVLLLLNYHLCSVLRSIII